MAGAWKREEEMQPNENGDLSADGAAEPVEESPEAAFDAETGALPAELPLEELVAQLQTELEGERARFSELTDRFQRSAADFQNARRRQERQLGEAIERASGAVIRRIIPVLDDFDHAFGAIPAELSDGEVAWVDGFRQIQRKLLAVLEEEGVTPMATEGEFDPTRHEAISSEPNDAVESGHIIATLRVGYEQNGHVIRPALVRVAA